MTPLLPLSVSDEPSLPSNRRLDLKCEKVPKVQGSQGIFRKYLGTVSDTAVKVTSGGGPLKKTLVRREEFIFSGENILTPHIMVVPCRSKYN